MATATDTTTDLGFDELIDVTSRGNDIGRTGRIESRNPEPQNRDSESTRIAETPNGDTAETLGGIPIIDTFDFEPGSSPIHGTDTGGGTLIDTGRRRRGRPPGSKNRTNTDTATGTGSKTETSPNLANLEAMLFSIHLMGARLLSVPELELEEREAKKLADAMAEVAKHYNFGLDPKKLAIANLIFCAGGIYGSRAVAVYKRNTSGSPKRVLQMPNPPVAREPEPSKPQDPRTITPSQIWDMPAIDNTVL